MRDHRCRSCFPDGEPVGRLDRDDLVGLRRFCIAIALLLLFAIMSACTTRPAFQVADEAVRADLGVQLRVRALFDVADLVTEAAEAWAPFGAHVVVDGAASLEARCGFTDPGAPNAVAYTDRTGIVFDCDFLIAAPREASLHAMAHELGHLLGITHHVDDPGALMWPTVTTVLVVTRTDADALYQVFGL